MMFVGLLFVLGWIGIVRSMGARRRTTLALLMVLLAAWSVVSGTRAAVTCTNDLRKDFPMWTKFQSSSHSTGRTELSSEEVVFKRHLMLTETQFAEEGVLCFKFGFSLLPPYKIILSREIKVRGFGVPASAGKTITRTAQPLCLNQIPTLRRNCCSQGFNIEVRIETAEGVFTGSDEVRVHCPVRRKQQFVNERRTRNYRNKYNGEDVGPIIDMDSHVFTRVVANLDRLVRLYKRNDYGTWVLRQTLDLRGVWRVYVRWKTVVLMRMTGMQIYHETSPGVWVKKLQAPQVFVRGLGAAVQGRRVACLTGYDVVSVYVSDNEGNWSFGSRVRLTSGMSRLDGAQYELLKFDQDGSLIVLNMRDFTASPDAPIAAEVFRDEDGDGRTFRRVQKLGPVDGSSEKFGAGGAVFAKGSFLVIAGANGLYEVRHPVLDVFRKDVSSGRYMFLQKLVPLNMGARFGSLDFRGARIDVTDTLLVVNDVFYDPWQPWKYWQNGAVYRLSSSGLWEYYATLRSDQTRLPTRLLLDGRYVVGVIDETEGRQIYTWGPF